MDSRVRASSEQLSTLLEYMETHGDLARPLAGAQRRIRSERLWSELTNILNAVGGGVIKTKDKWKKVWADWKSKAKKKGLAIRQHTRRTGGGPASRQTLSAFDERVLVIMGALAVEGQNSIEELGFNRSSPARNDAPTADDTVYFENQNETSLRLSPPQPSHSWPSTSQTPIPASRPLMCPPELSHGEHPITPSPVAIPSPSIPAAPAPAAPITPRRRQSPASRAPRSPPPARRRPQLRSPTTPQSTAPPSRPRLRAHRRRLAVTPFERAASDFTAVELRRLEIEEERMRLKHEHDMRALEVEHERNEVFRSLVNVAQAWLEHVRSRDNTEPLNNE